MSINNFKGKRNTNGFDKNPQNISRKGRPKRGFTQVNEVLKNKGYTEIGKQDYLDFLKLMMNTHEEDLKKLAADQAVPMYMRLMISELKNNHARSAFMKDIRDFAFGKADESVTHSVKARVLTKEEMQDYLKDLEEKY